MIPPSPVMFSSRRASCSRLSVANSRGEAVSKTGRFSGELAAAQIGNLSRPAATSPAGRRSELHLECVPLPGSRLPERRVGHPAGSCHHPSTPTRVRSPSRRTWVAVLLGLFGHSAGKGGFAGRSNAESAR
jgi:hypothetical protein